jgi:cytochrome c peroxidase
MPSLLRAATACALGLVALQAFAAPPAADVRAQRDAFARPSSVPYPVENGFSPDRELLGRTLFFDPRLSGSDWISCASCHNPGFAYGDGLPKAIGHGMHELGRRTPTLLNLAWGGPMFWDGRADGLEQQALGPIASPGEMNLPLEELEEKVRGIPGYAQLFAAAYPGEPIGGATIAKAIATFERTVVSGPAPFDRWVSGDERALPAEAKRGFALFTGKAGCDTCHSGWRFTDDGFYDLGLPDSDIGRGAILPGIVEIEHAFKTPTLREVDRRAPYMHDGSLATLADVVAFYNRGGDATRPSKAAQQEPLGLTAAEQADLVAFLHTLSGEPAPVVVPTLPR